MNIKFNFLIITIILSGLFACSNNSIDSDSLLIEEKDSVGYKLSLAQWSVHTLIFEGELSPLDFAFFVKDQGFEGAEYVSQLYTTEGKDFNEKKENVYRLGKELKKRSDSAGIRNVLIMIDQEGNLASSDLIEQDSAILRHKLWVDIAKDMGCHSVRVNLFGSEDDSLQWIKNSIDGLTKLSAYAKRKNINVLVENHGGFSSDAGLLEKVIQGVSLDNCGTLPDFGNFCLEREGGKRWGTPCLREYDKYLGVKQLMPYAKAVSVKSIEFDENRNETTIDYKKMLKIVKESGYTGFLGVEWESDTRPPEEGIRLTKELIERSL